MKLHRKSVCVIRHGYFPGCVRIGKEIDALCKAGYSVDVICLRRPGGSLRETVGSVRVSRMPHGRRRGSLVRYVFEYGLSLLTMCAVLTVNFFRHRYACIQVNTLPDALVFVTFVPRIFGAKVLLDMHEPTPELWITKYGENGHSLLLKFHIIIEQLAIKYANKVITVNQALRHRYVERGAEAEKIAVVRNVPNEEFAASQRQQISKSGFVLMTHGTIEQRYGHDVIIRALTLLRDKICNLHLYIVGDGEDMGRLRSLSNKLGCSDLITFTGQVPFLQVGEFVFRADVGLVPLLPSPFGELCQPNKLFEYVSLKKPAIVSRLRAVEETFDDSCVKFFKPGSYRALARCVLDLYDNPEKGKLMAENAYRRYKTLRWNKAKKFYLNIIEELIQRP